jgi:hypothetical protein
LVVEPNDTTNVRAEAIYKTSSEVNRINTSSISQKLINQLSETGDIIVDCSGLFQLKAGESRTQVGHDQNGLEPRNKIDPK